ncbi:unnamed protein product, partial [Phaeothamnion confervicola]
GTAAAAAAAAGAKPPLLYLPGMDGLGISAEAQLPALSENFDVYRMVLPATDRSTFAGLTNNGSDGGANSSGDGAIILGESFGGLLALGLALDRPSLVLALFLVNPASSIDRTPWGSLGAALAAVPDVPYRAGALLAFAGTIPDFQQVRSTCTFFLKLQVADVAGILLDPRRDDIPLLRRPAALASRIGDLWGQIGAVADNLPQDTLQWRLREWLAAGAAAVNPRLGEIAVPTLVVAGSADRLLPSRAEAERLAKLLKNCETMVVEGRGHVPLFDGAFQLAKTVEKHPAVAALLARTAV